MFIKANEKIEVELSWFGKYGQRKMKDVYYHEFDKAHKTPIVMFGKKVFSVCAVNVTGVGMINSLIYRGER